MTKQMKSTWTFTFGDRIENHAGMQLVGDLADRGYNFEELVAARDHFINLGAEAVIYYLNKLLPEDAIKFPDEDAFFLVVKNGVNFLGEESLTEKLRDEHLDLEYDTKYWCARTSKVKNKLARWNICCSDITQKADFEQGKGTIVNFADIKYTNFLRNKITEIFNDPELKMESNFYYDTTKTGIGYHGDTERRKVIGIRIGEDSNIAFNWFSRHKPVGKKFETLLSDGDIYVMSNKAVGFDWKKSSMYTLRHAAGCKKYTVYKEKPNSKKVDDHISKHVNE